MRSKLRKIEISLPKSRFRDSKGIALVLILWVMTILSVIVMEFCFAMRTELLLANHDKDELQLYAMAEGGFHRAISELIYKTDPKVQQWRKTLNPEETPPEKKEWVEDGRPYSLSYVQGTCEVRILSEAGKININKVSEASLRKIVGRLGLEGESRDVVVDSILDWRDPDDFYRLNGAENDYYQSLKEPYLCKNAPLDSINEMLLIRGVTPDLFYGKIPSRKEGNETNAERIGLKDLFSVYAPGEQTDINIASPLVLKFALGIPDEVSHKMVKAREDKHFENPQDLLRRIPDLIPLMGEVGRFILYRSPTLYYTVESQARKEGKSRRGIKAIVKIDPRENTGYKIIQWMDVMTYS